MATTTLAPVNQQPPYPTHSAERPCLRCDGEGFVYYPVPGGRWNRYIGTWEPDERPGECPECDGACLVPVERCDRCGLTEVDSGETAWDECQCSEDDLIAWEAGDRQPEVMTAAEHVAEYLRSHYTGGGTIYQPVHRSESAWAERMNLVADELREHATGQAERQLADRLEAMAERVAA